MTGVQIQRVELPPPTYIIYRIHFTILYSMRDRNPLFGMWLHLWKTECSVTVPLTSDRVFRIFVSGAYLSYYLR